MLAAGLIRGAPGRLCGRRSATCRIDHGSQQAARNPAAARSVEDKIRETVRLLSEHPKIGRALDQRPTVRVMPVVRYPYLVFLRGSGRRSADTSYSTWRSFAG
jgi:plasmid stabilization system protein ParE